jgi:hypothetical protein
MGPLDIQASRFDIKFLGHSIKVLRTTNQNSLGTILGSEFYKITIHNGNFIIGAKYDEIHLTAPLNPHNNSQRGYVRASDCEVIEKNEIAARLCEWIGMDYADE